MKYYLGRLNKNRYAPIECIKETDLTSLLQYTSSFDNETQLRNELIERELIDGEEKLAYVKKQKEKFSKIDNGEKIIYSDLKNFIDTNNLFKFLKNEKYNLKLYEFVGTYIKMKHGNANNPHSKKIVECTNELLNEIRHAVEVGYGNYEEDKDTKDLNKLIINFLRAYVGVYDSKTHDYKVTNGRYDVSARSKTDLLIILNMYNEYRMKQEISNYTQEVESNHSQSIYNQSNEEEFEDYDKEEFLTEEDFENYGMNPEEYRRLLKK